MHVYKTIEFSGYGRRALLLFLVAVIAALFGYYWYSIGQASYNAATLEKIDQNLAVMVSEIATLESKYIIATSAITEEKARELGFTEPVSVLYVNRESEERLAVSEGAI